MVPFTDISDIQGTNVNLEWYKINIGDGDADFRIMLHTGHVKLPRFRMITYVFIFSIFLSTIFVYGLKRISLVGYDPSISLPSNITYKDISNHEMAKAHIVISHTIRVGLVSKL